MFAYAVLALGSPNAVENRCWLAVAGLVAIGMGMIVAMSVTIAVGYPYNPLHGVMSFLILGMLHMRKVRLFPQIWSI